MLFKSLLFLVILFSSKLYANEQLELIVRQQRVIAYKALERYEKEEARLKKLGKTDEAELSRKKGVKVILREMRKLQIENDSLKQEIKQLKEKLDK